MAEEREAPAVSEGAEAAETGVVSEGAETELTNETLRDWVKRWCCGDLEGLPPISSWNTSKVTDMSGMFAGASSFNQPLGDWRLRAGCNTHEMFNERFRNSRPVKASCCAVS